jgi:hypothetical protein
VSEPKLSLILHRGVDGQHKLWACRGAGKGCTRNKYRAAKAPCVDCVPAHDERETVGALLERLQRGDA